VEVEFLVGLFDGGEEAPEVAKRGCSLSGHLGLAFMPLALQPVPNASRIHPTSDHA